jgi:hypothetical protein
MKKLNESRTRMTDRQVVIEMYGLLALATSAGRIGDYHSEACHLAALSEIRRALRRERVTSPRNPQSRTQ